MLARFRHFSDESDSDFVLRLIRDARVATIPLSAFYTDGTDAGVIRLSFRRTTRRWSKARGGCVRCKARTETGDGSVAPTRHRRSR